MNKTMKRNVVVSALLAIMLCVSLIVGATYALFTSESKVNVAVTSGKVDVEATVENLTLGTTLLNGNVGETSATENGNEITLTNIVPGDYVTFDIRIHNNSNVTVKYRTIIEKVEDNGLWNGLVVTFDGVKYEGTNAVKTDWTDMAVGSDDIIVSVKVALPEEAGNEYQDTSCKFAYTVEAVQGNAEVTQEWDGSTTTEVSKNTEDGKYHITTASEFAWMMAYRSGYATDFVNEKIVLDCNIDFGGATITGFGSSVAFAGSFDGQNHTISNFTIDRSNKEDWAGLFNYFSIGTLENLIVKNATIIGQSKVGALVGGVYDNATVKNCSVVDCTVVANRKAAGAIGYGQHSTIENVSVKDTTLYVESTDAVQYGKVVGYVNTGLEVTGSSDENVTVLIGATYVANGVMKQGNTYLISNANGLQWFADQVNENNNGFNGYTVKLTADINLNNAEWYPIGQNEGITADMQEFFGIFDGDGHTIKNLKIKSHTPEEIRNGYSFTTEDDMVYGVGFFGWLSGAVKNVTFENVQVTGSHFVGVVAGYFQYTGSGDIIENCTVKNCTVVATHLDGTFCGDKAGGVVGMNGVANGTIKNCKVENTTITAGRDAGQVVGCTQSGTIVEDCTATNVTVSAGSDCTDEDAGENIKQDIIGRDLR